MSLRPLRDALPPYAADLRANLDAVDDDRALSAEARWGCLLACAMAAGEPTVLRHVREAAAGPLGERGVEAAKAAAAVTTMNDTYYGAVAGLKNPEYATLPSGLRMEVLARPGADRDAFDLWCFCVSALDRCASAMDAQDQELRRRGAPPTRMQAALRIAAVVGATARVLAAEAALSAPEPSNGEGAGADRADGNAASPDQGRGARRPATETSARRADQVRTGPVAGRFRAGDPSSFDVVANRAPLDSRRVPRALATKL